MIRQEVGFKFEISPTSLPWWKMQRDEQRATCADEVAGTRPEEHTAQPTTTADERRVQEAGITCADSRLAVLLVQQCNKPRQPTDDHRNPCPGQRRQQLRFAHVLRNLGQHEQKEAGRDAA
jgi:hypothetical protein